MCSASPQPGRPGPGPCDGGPGLVRAVGMARSASTRCWHWARADLRPAQRRERRARRHRDGRRVPDVGLHRCRSCAACFALVGGAVLGMVIERLLLSPVHTGMLATLLAMWGAGIVLRRPPRRSSVPTPGRWPHRSAGPSKCSGSTIRSTGWSRPCRFWSSPSSVVIYRTSIGLRLRAIDRQPVDGVAAGHPTGAMVTGAFAVGTALAVLAGALPEPDARHHAQRRRLSAGAGFLRCPARSARHHRRPDLRRLRRGHARAGCCAPCCPRPPPTHPLLATDRPDRHPPQGPNWRIPQWTTDPQDRQTADPNRRRHNRVASRPLPRSPWR